LSSSSKEIVSREAAAKRELELGWGIAEPEVERKKKCPKKRKMYNDYTGW
jgi:hypothetical protein